MLKLNEIYPEPYKYTKKASFFRRRFQDVYDTFKLLIWHRYLPKIADKADFVFVSNCFYREFKRYVRLTKSDLKNHVHIIHNSVGEIFEKNSYKLVTLNRAAFDSSSDTVEYDFMTIGNNMDNQKYGIDLVDGLARKYSQYSFLIVGRGEFYKVHDVPKNVTWLDMALVHKDMLTYINRSKCLLLLTREDKQWNLFSELAVYGVPVITSNIAVCQEISAGFDNVELVENDLDKIDLPQIYEKLKERLLSQENTTYSYENTVVKEKRVINSLEDGYDFITIRNMMDRSVYCIDLLCELARQNPQYKFLLIGRGEFFNYKEKPHNITWVNKYMSQSEMLSYINLAKRALMLTRRDTQGVMACELATYGIPLITSDLPICQEIFADCPYVTFLNNSNMDLKKAVAEVDEKYIAYQSQNQQSKEMKWSRYFEANTTAKEIELYRNSFNG